MSTAKEDHPQAHFPAPSGFDASIRADLDLAAGLLTLLSNHDPRANDLANDVTELASHVLLRDRDSKDTVLDRIRQATRGVPAVAYGPRSSTTPSRCEQCDGTGWLEADPERRCEAPECTARGKDASDEDRAVCDLLSVCQMAKHLPLRAHEAMTAHRSGDPVAWKTLHRSVSELRHVFAGYPPAHLGPDEAQQREMVKLNMAEDPLCRSCARVKDHKGMPHLSVPVEGMDICRWCVRHLDETEDQRNARKLRGESIHEGIWPPLEHVKAHAEGRHVRQKQPGHVDGRKAS